MNCTHPRCVFNSGFTRQMKRNNQVFFSLVLIKNKNPEISYISISEISSFTLEPKSRGKLGKKNKIIGGGGGKREEWEKNIYNKIPDAHKFNSRVTFFPSVTSGATGPLDPEL